MVLVFDLLIVSTTLTRHGVNMETYTPAFSVAVEGIKGFCATGDAYARRNMADKKIPVLSCEGPCIRGEIARLAANLVATEVPSLARACHGEAFFVPHSAMAKWVKNADQCIMIDGCFLTCHGRVLRTIIPEERVVHIDALPFYNKYTDIFSMDDVPEEERKAVARAVANQIIDKLRPDDSGIAA